MKNKKTRKIMLVLFIIIVFVGGILIGRKTNSRGNMKNFKNESSTESSETVEKEVGTRNY